MSTDPTPTAPGLDAEDREALAGFRALGSEIHRFRCKNPDCRHYDDAGYFTPRDNDAASACFRWLRAAGYVSPEHVAAAKAEALREAADEMEATIADLRPTLGGAELSYANCTRLDVRLLRDRANRYEAAQNPSAPICGPSSPEAGADASDAERGAERGGER